MTWWHRLFHRRRHEEQLEKELRHHLDLHTSDLIAQGFSPEEAQRQARLALGGPEQVKEMCRDARGTRWLEELLQDLRFGMRILLKNPGFTLVVVGTLALGIGANTAIFGLVDALLLRPLPVVKAPSELVLLMRGDGGGPTLSYPDFTVLRERNEVLSDLALYTQAPISFGNNVRSEVVLGAMVSGNYFDVLEIKPSLGRAFLPEEDRTPGAHPVVVLSHSFWQSRFNSDRAVVGQTIVLNNRRFTVVGIAPPGFDGETAPMKVSLWIPVMMMSAMRSEPRESGTHDPLSNRHNENFGAIGRLKQGVSVIEAQAALETINRQLELSNPPPTEQGFNPNNDRSLRLISPQGIMIGSIREMAVTSSGLAGATVLTVLLIACANVANLLMARAARRRKEVAVRLAMGATRWRLIRQLLTESVLLALVGATAGLFLAYWINQLLMAFKPPFPPPFTFSLDLSFDIRTFAFTFLLAAVTGVIFGLVPALQASRPDVLPALKDESNAESPRVPWLNLRNALVITQVALSLALLISTGLFVRTLRYARQIDLGFKPDQVLAVSFNLRLQGYDEAKGREFYRQILERLERLPGVQTVSVTNLLPLGFMWLSTPVVPENREVPPNERVFAGDVSVDSKYFETIGTPLLRGRDFTAQDTIKSPPVAIVSEKLAHSLWPEVNDPGEALGKRLRVGRSNPISCEVIGVAKDSRNNIFNRLDREPEPTIYRPFAQNYSAFASLIVRTDGDPRGLISAVRREVAALDENLPPQDLQPLSETVSLASWSARTGAAVLGVFGLLGLVLAAIGIYGVMSYSVSRRTREIGLRMALGAETRDVIKLIVKQGMGLTLIGAMIGVMLAVAVTRLLASLLYGVTATDPATFAGVVLFVIGVAVLACYLPARRATKVDPMMALRCE
ncbi:MAG TPA: ABC transporter permease [Pyrinomonadaceae bacterium]|jgi:predicted permease|nr:ABC transporter permease [Pyrinomonadaceae bacterium]